MKLMTKSREEDLKIVITLEDELNEKAICVATVSSNK